MLVSELIDKLKKLDPRAEVVRTGGQGLPLLSINVIKCVWIDPLPRNFNRFDLLDQDNPSINDHTIRGVLLV